MIRSHAPRSKNLRVPARSEPAALDQERSFLLRIVGQSMKRDVPSAIGASRLRHNWK